MRKRSISLYLGTLVLTAIAPVITSITQTAIAENPPLLLTQTVTAVSELKGFNGAIISFALTPDGKTLIVAGAMEPLPL